MRKIIIVAVFLKRTLNDSAAIGVWEITESVDVLLSRLKLNEEEQELYNSFKNDQRRLHWLSYRNLLKQLISPDEYSHIVYDDNGKPYMADNPHYLSVAHSGKFSAVILSKRNQVGIDIERIHPKIERIVSKFLSASELNQITGDNRIEQLYVYWGAKEALYKLYGNKLLTFEENILINSFCLAEKGEFEGRICFEEVNRKFSLHYEKIEDYMMVYVMEGK